MDERQEQVQVGAGLQESRLNTDLINWLNKWGSHILSVVALIVLAYVGADYYQKYQDGQRDAAFLAYEAARGELGSDGVLIGRPESLISVAEEHAGKGSVAELARLDAADIWLGCAVRGLRPGADISVVLEEDALSDEEIGQYLDSAKTQYETVNRKASGDDDLMLFELRSLDGLAAVAMSQGDRDGARGYLTQLQERAGEKYKRVSKVAELTLARIDDYQLDFVLLPEANLPDSSSVPAVVSPQGATPVDTLSPQMNVPSGNTEIRPIDNPFAAPSDGGDDGEDDGSSEG